MLYVTRPQQSALESKMTISYDLWSQYSSICTVFHDFKIYTKSEVSTSVSVQVLVHIFQYLH